MIRSATLAGLLLLAALAPAGAQQAPPPLSALRHRALPAAPAAAYAAPKASGRPPSDALLALGGLAGGAVGLVGGAALGYTVETGLTGCQDDEFCGILGALGGGTLGEAVMLPLGVHLANGRRGSYALTFLGSTLAGVVGIGLATAVGDPNFATFVVPTAQLVGAVAAQKRSAWKRSRPEIDPAPATP